MLIYNIPVLAYTASRCRFSCYGDDMMPRSSAGQAFSLKDAGKDDAFVHQVGVLQALSTAGQTGHKPTRHDQRAALMKAAQFNMLEPAGGRKAVAKYLLWRSFHDEADENHFGPALHCFRDEVLADNDATDDVIFGLLYSGKYEWQRWLPEYRDASAVSDRTAPRPTP